MFVSSSVGGSGRRSAAGSGFEVERNRSARGPSRMLARLGRAILQDLLSQLAVVVGRVPLRIVLQDARAPDRGLGELDRLANPRLEDELAEVLLEDLHRLLGVDRA